MKICDPIAIHYVIGQRPYIDDDHAGQQPQHCSVKQHTSGIVSDKLNILKDHEDIIFILYLID